MGQLSFVWDKEAPSPSSSDPSRVRASCSERPLQVCRGEEEDGVKGAGAVAQAPRRSQEVPRPHLMPSELGLPSIFLEMKTGNMKLNLTNNFKCF